MKYVSRVISVDNTDTGDMLWQYNYWPNSPRAGVSQYTTYFIFLSKVTDFHLSSSSRDKRDSLLFFSESIDISPQSSCKPIFNRIRIQWNFDGLNWTTLNKSPSSPEQLFTLALCWQFVFWRMFRDGCVWLMMRPAASWAGI